MKAAQLKALATGEQAPNASPTPWCYSTRGIATRLFITCWLIYVLHMATNTVREIYLALAIGDHFSFRVDDYANMHPDLFEKPGYGWHIGANPGASMLAAIPYAALRPLTDRIVEGVNRRRTISGNNEPPAYNSPWPMAREFYRESWKRGYDVKFGLASVVTQTMCMAPISAAGVVAMFLLLRVLVWSDRTAFWLSVLYAFGTPVFYRTGYLNHNMILGHVAFIGFLLMWNPSNNPKLADRTRYLLGGVAGGTTLLMDYSAVVMLLGLFVYGMARSWRHGLSTCVRLNGWYVIGTLPPVTLLWWYQWRSFGHPFYPGQHWMPPVEWIDVGYQGFSWPHLDLLSALVLDYRFGLFTTCPILLLALSSPFLNRGKLRVVPIRELAFLLGLPGALWLFCGGISYTRLQFNTGLRYLAPLLPFLFVPTAVALLRLPRRLVYFASVAAIAQAWCMAMYRDVERGLGILDPLLHVFLGGLTTPALTVLSRMGNQYGSFFEHGTSPVPVFLLTGAILYGVWSSGFEKSGRNEDHPPQSTQ